MEHRLADRVRASNPAPDPDALMSASERADFFAEIERRSGLITPGTVVGASTPPIRWRRAVVAGVAVVIALALAGLFALSQGEPDVITPSPTLPAPGESESPIEIVTAFFTKWNERDVTGAVAYLHPEALSGRDGEVGSVQWWENYLSYSVAAFGGEWRWILRDCTEPTDTAARCLLTIENEPLADAILVPAVPKQWDVRDGLIVRAPVLLDLTLAEAAVDRYAREQDPVGHAAACSIDGRDLLGELIVYDAPCGEFIAPYRLSYARQLLTPEG